MYLWRVWVLSWWCRWFGHRHTASCDLFVIRETGRIIVRCPRCWEVLLGQEEAQRLQAGRP